MARIRTIKPEFPQSESMGRVSREARLCFVLMWTIADDAGRLRGASRMLASLLYPYDDDAPSLMDGWLKELEDEGCIVRYSVGGSSYIQIAKWLEHQKIDKPSKSKIPEFSESSRSVESVREASATDLGPRTVDQEGNNPPIAPQPSEPTRRDGLVDEIDQIRMAVWRQAGLNEDAILTKLVSTSQEGVRQARGWLEKFTLAEALAIITEAYDCAESRGDAIRRPWVYLDRVFATKAEEKANPPQPVATKADPWENRRGILERGIWAENYGARPGNVACDAPKWAQELFLANKHKREGRAA